MAEDCALRDPVVLMLRTARTRALQSGLLAAIGACSPPVVVPAAMPVKPGDPPPLPPSAAPPEVAVNEPIHCDQRTLFPVSAVNLKLAAPADYVALRSYGGMPNQGDPNSWTEVQFEVLSQHGVPCESAPAQSPCKALVARHPAGPANAQCVQICREISVVTTRGALVQRWATPEELRELLAPIDTVDEALLLVVAERYSVSCESESTRVRRVPGGYEVFATRLTSSCAPMVTTGYWLRVTGEGTVSQLSSQEVSRSEACVGRRPQGMQELTDVVGSHVSIDGRVDPCATFLAHSAYLEAASVHAFERLAQELEAWGAPTDLIQAARSAREDEVRHARDVGALARERGAFVPSSEIEMGAVRELEAIALENAIEGCVRETYGAMIGAFQAVRARDAKVRAQMATIAEDELGHAALAHRVHAWILPKLNQAARGRVLDALRRTVVELFESAQVGDLEARGSAREQNSEVTRVLGLPNGHEARAMLTQLDRDVWRSSSELVPQAS